MGTDLKKTDLAETNPYVKHAMSWLQFAAKILAILVCIELLISSTVVILNTFQNLSLVNLAQTIDDGLFVLILLEMFYVVWSFIKYHTINVSLIINVGVIATVKEMVFQLENMTLQLAATFAILLVSLGIIYFVESRLYNLKFKSN